MQPAEALWVCDTEVKADGAILLWTLFWKYIILPERKPMSQSLAALETRRSELLHSIANLQDMRPGSIVGAVFRCGKPGCHCALPDDPGHGPNLRLTHKVRGKTVTEALSTPAAVRKAEQEIAEFRRYRELSHELVEVSERVCRLRPVEDTLSPEEKKRPKRSVRRSRAK
jgi:hypothetical protein